MAGHVQHPRPRVPHEQVSVDANGTPPRYPIDSVDKALSLLSLFLTRDRIRVKDAAEELGVASGTAHRLLAMLQYRGYVEQDEVTKVYVPGRMLVNIGLRASERLDLRGAARPVMEQLAEQVDETIQLATLQGTHVVFIDGIESTQTLKVASRVGTLRPAHCTSVGKALLAELAAVEIARLYPSDRMLACTASSISSRRQLRAELRSVRARGYAINVGELEDGIGSVAAVIHDVRDRPVGALGAGAPISRLDDRRLEQLARAVCEAADRITAELAR